MMVSIIVPCYNEEEALPYFMREIRRTEAELSAPMAVLLSCCL